MSAEHELGSGTHQALHESLRGMDELNYETSRPGSADYTGVNLPLQGQDDRKRVVSDVTLTDKGIEHAENAGIVDRDDAGGTDGESGQTPDTDTDTDTDTDAVVETATDGGKVRKDIHRNR